MTILKDITSVLRDAKGIAKELDIASRMRASSIARMSSDATLQFPVIMSRSINVNTAQSVTKALERQYAIMVQIVISTRYAYIDIEKDDIISHLKKFHQNNISMDIMESCMNVYSNEAYDMYLLASINHGSNGNVVRSNKEQLFNIEECLNQYKINDMYQPEQITMEMAEASLDYYCKSINLEAFNGKNYPKKTRRQQYFKERDNIVRQYARGGMIVPKPGEPDYEAFKQGKYYGTNSPENNPELHKHLNELNSRYGVVDGKFVNDNNSNTSEPPKQVDVVSNKVEKEVNNNDVGNKNNYKSNSKSNKNITNNTTNNNTTNKTTNNNTTNNYINQANEKDNQLEKDKFDETKKQNKLKNELENKKLEMDLQKAEADYRARIQVKLADNDVKKANELVPTTLSITLMTTKGDNFGGNQNFVIGVKGIMHPVESNDMIGNLLDGYRSGNKFFNFIRWTTGEIAFIKDLLLNIDELKDDVIKKHTKGNSKWWTILKRRKAAASIKNRLGKGKILPNATIVCSMEEVVELNDVYGLDLMNSGNVKKLMERYHLLGFAIVDESQELCYFIFDGETDFQALSFLGLEKENNSTNDFKEIYKMINSGRL